MHGVQVPFLVRELRSHMLSGQPKNNNCFFCFKISLTKLKKKKNNKNKWSNDRWDFPTHDLQGINQCMPQKKRHMLPGWFAKMPIMQLLSLPHPTLQEIKRQSKVVLTPTHAIGRPCLRNYRATAWFLHQTDFKRDNRRNGSLWMLLLLLSRISRVLLEWFAISLSSARKWKVKVKSLSRVRLFATHGLQPTRLLLPRDFPGKSTGVGCHCLLCGF